MTSLASRMSAVGIGSGLTCLCTNATPGGSSLLAVVFVTSIQPARRRYRSEPNSVLRHQLVFPTRVEFLRREGVAVGRKPSPACRRRPPDERQSSHHGSLGEEVVFVRYIAEPEELPPNDLVLA